jgi:hypothetical protein
MAVLMFRSVAAGKFVIAASPVYVLNAKAAAPDIIIELLERDCRRIRVMIGKYHWFALNLDTFTGRIVSIDHVEPAHRALQRIAMSCVRVRIERLSEPANLQ